MNLAAHGIPNACTHRGLRNEMDVEVSAIQHSGSSKPWGGFYCTVVCPDCGEEMRAEAPIMKVWPSGWRVIDGKPVRPDRLEDVLARKRENAEAE